MAADNWHTPTFIIRLNKLECNDRERETEKDWENIYQHYVMCLFKLHATISDKQIYAK